MKIAEYIERNESALPPALADMLLQECSIWTNDVCYGYCLIALKNAGMTDKIMEKVTRCLHSAFDEYSVEEAEEVWCKW